MLNELNDLKAKLAEAQIEAKLQHQAGLVHLAEVERLRVALEDISRLHLYGTEGCDKNDQCGCAGCLARAALRSIKDPSPGEPAVTGGTPDGVTGVAPESPVCPRCGYKRENVRAALRGER